MNKKTIGIIGGMGPMATVDLFHKIVKLTKAENDKEHIHIIIDNYPQIPDRTAAILESKESPVPYILKSAKNLIKSGAELLLIPCNTSHYYYQEIATALSVPVLNMLRLTAEELKNENVGRVGLLATDGTIKTKVFENMFASLGIETVCPDSIGQSAVMNMIYKEIKAGKTVHCEPVIEVMNQLRKRGAQRIVLGCTELPLAFEQAMTDDMVDPARILAVSAIKQAGYEII